MSSPTINLIPAHRLQTRHRVRVLRGWLGVLIGYGLLLVFVGAGAGLLWGGSAKNLADQQASVRRGVSQKQAQLQTLNQQRTSAQKHLRANQALSEQPDWSVLLGLLGQTLPDHVILRRCAFTPMPLNGKGSIRSVGGISLGGRDPSGGGSPNKQYSGFTVAVSGYAKTYHRLNRYVRTLEKVGLFERVRRLDTRREPIPGTNVQAISFRLGCDVTTSVKEGAGAISTISHQPKEGADDA